MKAIISTVSEASVTVDGQTIAEVTGPALLALIGAGRDDAPDSWETMARKIAELRLFPADPAQTATDHWEGSRDTSVEEIGGSVLVVSQFTLMGRTAKGRRPSWSDAAPGPEAEPIIEKIVAELCRRGICVATGQFGANMAVQSVNQGPFTVLVET
ncbi:D-aminoacyl-tRNA deacylase [Corynebacterium auriscanis]|uniref:D-aminoacyl-tRNA deacylase n=1 Tax=Corynebacterium auriscanis TaxID=99807 RepID=UPI0024AD5E57|nr:D-aminoacyl-tRNA deacylase [Corynebacterium auriscanis]